MLAIAAVGKNTEAAGQSTQSKTLECAERLAILTEEEELYIRENSSVFSTKKNLIWPVLIKKKR